MNIKSRYSLIVGPLLMSGILLGQVACNQNASTPVAEKPAAQPAPVLPAGPGAAPAMGGSPSEAAGVAWTIPSGWEVEAARQMRVATYRIRAIAGDPEDAECAVYFFGTGQGGTVEANLDRWTKQFASPDGQSAPQAKTGSKELAGMKVSTLTVSGTYLGGGPMMGGQEVKKPNFRMLGAIVDAPQGLVFFKLTGPLNTVASAENDFNFLLGSLHRQ